MRIFLIRHGFSEGNEDLSNYPKRGDPHIQLTDKGWQQAIAAGEFLKKYIKDNPGSSLRPPRIWSSTFMRTRQTAAGVIYGADGALDAQDFHTSPLLVEQNFGLYSYLHEEKDRTVHLPMAFEFYNVAYDQDKYSARPPMGESPMDVQTRVFPFVGTLMRDKAQGVEDAVVVTHGVTLRALAMAFMKIDPAQYKNFKNPENCSIYLIEGGDGVYYTFRQIYNGETGQEVSIDWGEKLKAHEYELPSVPPQHRKAGPKPV